MTSLAIAGSGEPALVFVHGVACALDDWDHQVAEFAPRHLCLALDLPGHGGSAMPPRADIDILAEAVNAARSTLGARSTVLIGHSMGCKVIREAYSQAPQGLAGLVMIDGRHNDVPEEGLAHLEAAISENGIDAYLQDHFREMLPATVDPAVRDRILDRLSQLDADYIATLLRKTTVWDGVRGPQTLEDIRVPVLVLQSTVRTSGGRRGPLQPGMTTPFMDLVARLVPDARFEVIPDCGHFTMIERPDLVNAEIRRFLDSLPDGV